jgi:hypothetical protein
MRLGITDKGYKRLQGMPFLAEPPIPQSESYGGVVEFPGFHTAGTFEIAAAYATGRVSYSMTEDVDGSHYVTDYPVVIQLDMSGYDPQSDYDAEEIVKQPLGWHLRELIDSHNLTLSSTDEEIIEAGEEFIDMSTPSSDETTDWEKPYDVIFKVTFRYMHDALPSLISNDRFPELVRTYIETGEIDSSFLMAAADQYRYTEDVDEERVQAVWFVQPIAEEALTYDNDEDEEFAASWEGFDLPHEDDLMSAYDEFQYTSELVYGTPQDGGQYHGTTYHRLLQAAPGLAESLPAPPSPPYQGE